MKLAYQKLHGCKNSYYFIDLLKGSNTLPSESDLSSLAQRINQEAPSGESDGLILVYPPVQPSQADARMKMFNRDGSEAEMCGNGIRGLGKLLFEEHGQKPSYRIETEAGVREVFIQDHSQAEQFELRVNMGRPSFLPAKIPVSFDDVMVMNEEFEAIDQEFKLSCVSMGNPHSVIEVSDLENFDVKKYGEFISKHEVFPQGCNVNFFQIKGDQVHLRTFERGSGETQACGTGACATAVALLMQKRLVDKKANIITQGGELLIEWDGLREVWMTGEAVTEAKGEFEV